MLTQRCLHILHEKLYQPLLIQPPVFCYPIHYLLRSKIFQFEVEFLLNIICIHFRCLYFLHLVFTLSMKSDNEMWLNLTVIQLHNKNLPSKPELKY